MNNQKAIEIIKNTPLYRYECENENQSELFKALHMAVQALEKQIPAYTEIKIYDEDVRIGHHVIFSAGTQVHHCPICHAPVTGSDEYCRKCGQAIIW